MSWWRQLTRGLRVLLRPQSADQDVADEVQDYLEEAIAAKVASGLSPAEARRAARLEFGGAAVLREQVRSYGWENAVGTLFADLRYATRQLRGNPGFAIVSVLILALGIGATTSIFSALNPILFEPLPYPDASRIMMIWYAGEDGSRVPQAFHTYREIAERSRSFDATAVMKPWLPALTGANQPERLEGQQVSADFFRALAASPSLGRDLQASDDVFHGPRVVILSDGLWRRSFGADPAILGRQVRLDDNLYRVVGVMPGTFENVLAPTAEIWSPLQYDTRNITSTDTREWGHHLRMVGRVRAGVGTDQARRELNAIARDRVPEFPRPAWSSIAYGLIVDSLQDDVTRGVKPALFAVLGAVMLLLLIACVNVTNLVLARGAQRRGEFAMRAALGASRSRLLRQLITESLLLAVLGGALGLLMAQAGVRALLALSPAGLPRANAIAVNGPVYAFALGVIAIVGLLVGLVPALYGSSRDLHVGIQQSSRRAAGGHQVTRRTLVVVEVALALVLLVSAGLLLRSLERLFAVDPGFDSSHLLTMQVQTFGRHYEDDPTCNRFFANAQDAVRRVPGVTAAAFTSLLPLSGESDVYGASFEGDSPDAGYAVSRYGVTSGYFEAIGIPLHRGRLLNERDGADAPRVAVISESLAARRFPGQDPIGKRFHMGGPRDSPLFTIVGVVGDVRQTSLAVPDFDAVYTTADQWHWADGTRSLVVRTHGDPAVMAPVIEKAVWSVDKDQPIVRVLTMDGLVTASAAERRFVLVLFEAFALVALALAATGIYGVLSGSVNERTREIGVRVAVGASPRDILALVVRQGMTLTGMGLVIGLSGAILASQALVTLLFGISRLDPMTYAGVVALLAVVSIIACWVPAWRAAKVDPSITLRAE
ncbi:MAG TPA: ABC transporter permease [Terriglobales bacterium]|jgi:putative ABC transport system permease protein|nr:ABC transporter permease [Terriglobales bacterium]